MKMGRTRNFADAIRAKLAANPDLAEAVEAELFNADLATKVYEARKAAGLTQKQLADLAGTQQSVISRIEDADYEGRSLNLLSRIAKALGLQLRVEFYGGPSGQGARLSETYSIEWTASSWENILNKLTTEITLGSYANTMFATRETGEMGDLWLPATGSALIIR